MTTNGHGSPTQYCHVTTSTCDTCPLPWWTTHITQQDKQATMAHWSKLDKLGLWVFFLFSYSFFLFTNSSSTVRPWVPQLKWQSPTQQLGWMGLVLSPGNVFSLFFCLFSRLLMIFYTAPTPHTQLPLSGQPPQGQPPRHTVHPRQPWHIHPLPSPAHGHVKMCLPPTTTMCGGVHQWQETKQWD